MEVFGSQHHKQPLTNITTNCVWPETFRPPGALPTSYCHQAYRSIIVSMSTTSSRVLEHPSMPQFTLPI